MQEKTHKQDHYFYLKTCEPQKKNTMKILWYLFSLLFLWKGMYAQTPMNYPSSSYTTTAGNYLPQPAKPPSTYYNTPTSATSIVPTYNSNYNQNANNVQNSVSPYTTAPYATTGSATPYQYVQQPVYPCTPDNSATCNCPIPQPPFNNQVTIPNQNLNSYSTSIFGPYTLTRKDY